MRSTRRRRRRREGGKLADPILRAEIAEAAIDTYASEATRQRYLAEAADGGEIGARSALLKYDGTELNKRRHELLMALAGAEGLYFDGNLGPAQDVAERLAALEGQFDRGRHVGNHARHRRQTAARTARGLRPHARS